MAAHSGPKQQLAIVGNGMVGHHCLEQLVEQGALDAFEIHVFGAERQRAYDRVHLSEYFGGRDAESLALGQAELYAREGVQLHLDCPVLELDPQAREVVTAQGRFRYEHELSARGVAVDHSLCEHFSHTRQELYGIIRVEGIKRFEDVLARHGKGSIGCDICKPAIGSILASCWNEPVMDPALVPLQDTNDTFMANMQKNGTYSVVPRIAGGEITPDKLIVLGEVARKYDLYTKITGGQRIDLFGAQLHQLPDIWAELIAAGFETGHAYGKSLRTVKSCVGSTWCRYGVQDSVGMALKLENRYKGLRAPHKIKFGVSGCTRECAEAQSKDIGVIATERGWNLYVAGNGGMRPRHAELFATDLDEETLIRTIDRFLMFYIRTADRLQRTSTWRESLDGGLDYLKKVILEDSLGLGAELEEQMQQVIDRYECEWANALKDPEKLKRFRTFVNDQRADPDIRFVRERGQPRPAPGNHLKLIPIEEEAL